MKKNILPLVCVLGCALGFSGISAAEVYKAKDTPVTKREKVAGGTGELSVQYAFKPADAPLRHAVKEISYRSLPPGASVGVHKHEKNEDCYLIVSGTANYTEDGKEYALTAGDMTVCREGCSHGLANSGKEPLVYFVVTAEK